MKELGRTKDGNHIVEMNQDEYRELVRLHRAVSGKSGQLPESRYGEASREWEFDFSNVFDSIRAYYLNRFAINDLQALLDEMKERLEAKTTADR